MNSPFDDFATWLAVSSNMISTPKEFVKYAPNLIKFITSVIETDFLPEEIKEYTDNFLSQIQTEFLSKILKLGAVPKEDMAYYVFFLEAVLRLGNYGIKSNKTKLIYMIEYILANLESGLAPNNSDFKLEVHLPKYAAEIGIYQNAIELVKNGIDTIDNLYYITNICIRISTFVRDYDFWVLANVTTDALDKIVTTIKIREVKTQTVSKMFQSLKTNAIAQETINPDFIQKWLKLLTFMMKPEIFEKRLFGFQTIKDLMETQKTSEITKNLFAKDPSVLDGSVLHEEFCSYIGYLLNQLCSAHLIEFSLISKLFSRYSTLHISELPKFYSIFSTIAKMLDQSMLSDFVDLIISPQTKESPWYTMVEGIGAALGARNDAKTEFMKLRDYLNTLKDNGDKEALSALSQIIQYHLSEEEFKELIEKMTSSNITIETIELLKNITANYPLGSQEFAENLVNIGLNLVTKDKVAEFNTVYDFLFNVCFMNQVPLNKEQIKKIWPFAVSSEAGMSTCVIAFLNNMRDICLIEPDDLSEVIISSDLDLNSAALQFIVIFIKSMNDISIKSMPQVVMDTIVLAGKIKDFPLQYEDILWEYCSRPSPIQQSVCKNLCFFYASNDISVPDRKIISLFLNKWCEKTEKSNQKLLMVKLLEIFIEIFEFPLDIESYGVKRHQPNNEKVNIHITSPIFSVIPDIQVPYGMSVSGLHIRLSKLTGVDRTKFNLTHTHEIIHGCVKLTKDRSIMAVQNNEYTDTPYPPIREVIPTQIIPEDTRTMNLLTELLINNVANVKQIFDNIPTLKTTMEKLKILPYVKKFEYNTFLDIKHPNFFLYNLDGLTNNMNEELKSALIRTGGFNYLIQQIPNCNVEIIDQLTNFISKNLDSKEEFAQLVFDFAMPALPKFFCSPDHFNSLSQFILTFLNGSQKVKCSNPSKYFEYLKSDITESIRIMYKKILTKVEFDMSTIWPLYQKGDTYQFFEVFSSHIDKEDENLSLFIVNSLKRDISENVLLLAKELISRKLISDEHKKEIIDFLVDQFLTFDPKQSYSKEINSLAMKIISLEQNEKLLNKLKDLHDKKIEWDDKKYEGDQNLTKSDYVGLINLGATCFMNSTLQQFFMIPELREKIISYRGDDEFMKELSNLYAKLFIAKTNSITTEQLVSKWIGWDGEKINPHTQQDASEFVLSLLDKLENGLGKEFIQKLFQQITCTYFDGLSETYHSESSGKNYTLSLAVKDCNSFDDSLEKFNAVDYFTNDNQYKPDGFDHKIDAVKSQKLTDLPPHLIIQLSRFDYNYTTWERLKINSVLEIPSQIDLKKVIKDVNLTKYNLRGVICHMGSAFFGHYISYIKERKQNGKWYCFNDSNVSVIDEKDVLKNSSGQDNGKSGYLLFYDREDLNETENEDKTNILLQISEETKNAVLRENLISQQTRLLCSQSYNELMVNLSGNKDFVPVVLRYLFDTIPHTTYMNSVEKIGKNILEKVDKNIDISIVKSSMKNVILSSSEKLRDYASQIILKTSGIDVTFWLSLLPELLPKYYYIQYYFIVLDGLTTKSDTEVLQKGFEFLEKDIPEYKKQKDQYFNSQIEISYLFNALSKFTIPYELKEDLLEFIFGSKSQPHHVVNFLLAFEKRDEVFAKFENFIEKHSVFVKNFELLATSIMLIYKENGFDMMSKVKCKIEENVVSDKDFATIHAVLSLSQRELYLENMGKWLLKYLVNDVDTRTACLQMISFICPIDSFNSLSYLTLNKKTYTMKKYDNYLENAQKVTDYMTSHLTDFISLVRESYDKGNTQYIGQDYLRCLQHLSKECKIDYSLVYKSFLELTEFMFDYDVHIKEFIVLLQKSDIEIPDELLLKMVPLKSLENNNLYVKMMNLFTLILPKIHDDKISADFAKDFVRYYAFPFGPFIKVFYDVIITFVDRLCKLHKPALKELVSELNVNEILIKNYGAIIHFLQMIDEKREILSLLPLSISKVQYFPQDKLLEMAFEANDFSKILSENSQYLISGLATKQTLSKESRNRVWNFMIENKFNVADFIKNHLSTVMKEDYYEFGLFLMTDIKEVSKYSYVFSSSIKAAKLVLNLIDVKSKTVKEWREFIVNILKVDIENDVETMSKIMEIVPFVCESEDDLRDVLLPFHEILNGKCQIVSDIILFEGKPNEKDLADLISYLTIVERHNMYSGPIIQNVGYLMSLVTDRPEYTEIFKLCRRIILV